MSACGYKRTYSGQLANVRFTPESGHSEAQERVGLKKRTLDVRFAPNSGRNWVTEFMSAYDPKRTLALLGAHWRGRNRVILLFWSLLQSAALVTLPVIWCATRWA